MMPLKNLVDGNRTEGSSFGIPSHFANDFWLFLEPGAGVSLPVALAQKRFTNTIVHLLPMSQMAHLGMISSSWAFTAQRLGCSVKPAEHWHHNPTTVFFFLIFLTVKWKN